MPKSNPQVLSREASGLYELAKPQAIQIPCPIICHDKILVLPFIESSRPSADFWRLFGSQLAKLHRYQGDAYGFREDNFIGASPQSNRAHPTWLEFFWHERLLFQLHLLETKKMADSQLKKGFAALESRLPDLLSEPEGPSLVHGDLWSGNFLCSQEDQPVLIDPAVYYGDREVDLAMTRLFGGFDQEFYEAYQLAYPLREGAEDRKDLYNLYHVLNHLNLFGSSYYGQAMSILNKYLA